MYGMPTIEGTEGNSRDYRLRDYRLLEISEYEPEVEKIGRVLSIKKESDEITFQTRSILPFEFEPIRTEEILKEVSFLEEKLGVENPIVATGKEIVEQIKAKRLEAFKAKRLEVLAQYPMG